MIAVLNVWLYCGQGVKCLWLEVVLFSKFLVYLLFGTVNDASLSMQLAESAKLQFSCRDYSDHLALVRAYDGWREAERDRAGYDYCWKNFLSVQTLKAIDSLRRQFLFLLKDTGLVDENMTMCNKWSRDENLVRAVICAGLYPGVSSVLVSFFYLRLFYIPCF